jgi:hypothetical protein
MATLNEDTYKGDIVKMEGDQRYSREVVTIGSGANLVAGRVLGRVTATGRFVALAPGASDGSQVAAAVLLEDAAAAAANVDDIVVLVRHAIVESSRLGWGSLTAPQIVTATGQLASLGIIARKGA